MLDKRTKTILIITYIMLGVFITILVVNGLIAYFK